MNENVLTAYASKLDGGDYEEKLILWRDAVLSHPPIRSFLAKFLSMRDWLVMRFQIARVSLTREVSNYVKRVIPKKEQWNEYLVDSFTMIRLRF